ncbi:MAG: NmrA family NAD(P)-binding protein [Deltaproteobacteria bacterium]|nr:NmrA family NAD(P)-binding protein [Deltaproteobacteria bacterium]
MYVVAGVSGHVGSVVANELLSHGEKVKVLVRDAKKGTDWSKKGAEVGVASLDDAKALATALKGAKGFFTLLPPNYDVKNGFYAMQRKTADAIAAAVKEAGVPHVVLLSSVGADLAEGNGPIKGLHHLENALRATGTQLTAVRAGYFQENIGNSLAPAKNAGIFPNMTPNADYPMPMIATRDIGTVAAYELMFPSAKSEIVDLHGPAYSVRQGAEKLGAALGKKLQVVDIPAAGHVKAMTDAGMPQEIAEAFAEMYAGFASGKIVPKGDRLKTGSTTIDTVIKAMV